MRSTKKGMPKMEVMSPMGSNVPGISILERREATERRKAPKSAEAGSR